MARPLKNSLSYFSFDTDFFNCRKIKRLLNGINGKGGFGGKGALVFICLLCEGYRENGYFVEWDAEYSQDIADSLGAGFSAGLVEEVKTFCIEISLFDKELYEQHQILTSASMQARYIAAKEATGKRKYKPSDIIKPEYIANDLLNYAENCGELPDFSENNEELRKMRRNSTKRKVKESKVVIENQTTSSSGIFDASGFLPTPEQTEIPRVNTSDGNITADPKQITAFFKAIGASQWTQTEAMAVSRAIEEGCTVEHLKQLLKEKPKITSFKADWVIRELIAVKRKSDPQSGADGEIQAELEKTYGRLT